MEAPQPERPRAGREDLLSLRIDRDGAEAKRRSPLRGWLGLLLLILVFAVASFAAWRLTLGSVAVVRVAYAKATGSAPAGEVLAGSGYVVTGDRYISLGVRVPSRIEAYRVEEGETVEAGALLVQLDARSYEAALREARAQLALARADADLQRKEVARARELRDRDVTSQAQLDIEETELRRAEAEVTRSLATVARAEVDLEDTVIRAPTPGVILEKLKEVGEIAVPGGFAGSGELIRMANLEDLRAEVDVNESDLSRVHLGQPAEVVPDAYPDRSYRARVVKLYPQINRQKGTLEVEVHIEEPDAWLRPDMSVRIRFLADAAPAADPAAAAVVAPRAALREEAGDAYVWVVSEGRVRRQPVEVGSPSGSDGVVVASGLSGGEALVVGDAESLREGQAVEVEAP